MSGASLRVLLEALVAAYEDIGLDAGFPNPEVPLADVIGDLRAILSGDVMGVGA